MVKTIKDRYLDVMERALECYSRERIENYIQEVCREGLSEHGFPRLAANIGLLITQGRKKELLPVFLEIMDLCCEQIPLVKANNEFSIKELCLLLQALEWCDIVPRERIEGWRTRLSEKGPLDLYKKVYTLQKSLNNWALFAAVSEQMRLATGIGGERDFVDKQLDTQMHLFDENGMYRDPHEPMVYDLVSRQLLMQLLEAGYTGKYQAEIEQHLLSSATLTLQMQSVTGEIPFGGRSSQFLHNEALLAGVMEWYARYFARKGERCLAGQCKSAARLALEAVERWLDFVPGHHIKNRFDVDSFFGCEKYGYFNKYMITLASNIYQAWLFCDENIEEVSCPAELGGYTAQTSDAFHKVFINEGGYFLQFELQANAAYDGSGLGRIHKNGVPSALCLSIPFTDTPNYGIEGTNDTQLSICPDILGASSKAQYRLLRRYSDGGESGAEFTVRLPDGRETEFNCRVNAEGVVVEAERICLPLFSFDGAEYTDISATDTRVCVRYAGHSCTYTASCIELTDKTYANRNGIYRLAYATGPVQICIE